MEEKSIKLDVKMNKKAMRSFLFQHNYASAFGIIGIFISILAIILLIWKRDTFGVVADGLLILVGLLFIVIKPIMIIIQTGNVLKNEMCYQTPMNYIFDSAGIVITQDKENEFLPWTKVNKVALTAHMLALYDTKSHAFVIPVDAMQEDKENVIKLVCRMAADYNVALAGKLKKYVQAN